MNSLKKLFFPLIISLSALSLKAQNTVEHLQNLNDITKVLVDKDKSVWAGNTAGYILHFTNEGKLIEQFFLEESKVTGLVQCKDGLLLATTYNKFYTYKDGKWVISPFWEKANDDSQKILFEDNKKNIYAQVHGDALFRRENNSWNRIFTSDIPTKKFILINGIYIDSKNNTWIYNSYGLDKFDGKNWEYDVQKSVAQNSNAIYQVIEDERNNLWFVTDGDGFVKYDGKNWTNVNKWKYNTMFNEFPRWKSRRLFIDKKSKKLNCIFNDMNSIIYELQADNYWKMETETSEISKHINDSFTQDSTILYISSKQGIIKKDGGNIKFLRTDKSILSNNISSIFVDSKERIWISSKLDELSDGIITISKNEWKKYNDLIQQSSNVQFRDAFSISEDLKGNIWVGNNRNYGMYKFNGLEWQQFSSTTTNGKVSNNIKCFYQDSKNNVWIGHSWGLSKFDGKNWTLIRLLDFKDYIIGNMRNGETGVFEIVEDKQGVIWAATFGGLLKYKGDQLSILNTNNKRVPDNSVSSIFLDSSDRLIMFTGKEMYYFKDNNWQNISLPNVSVKLITQSKDKDIFFISNKSEIYKLIDNQWQIVINNLGKNISETDITSFFVDKSNFWIGTSDNGVFKIKK